MNPLSNYRVVKINEQVYISAKTYDEKSEVIYANLRLYEGNRCILHCLMPYIAHGKFEVLYTFFKLGRYSALVEFCTDQRNRLQHTNYAKIKIEFEVVDE